MLFKLTKKGNPSFSRMDPILGELFLAAALDPWERYPEAGARLLPLPGEDEGLRLDWQDHVQPELRRHFDHERSLVAHDLRFGMIKGRGKTGVYSLEIPIEHVDAWLTTLNALRLALVEGHGFTEADLLRKTLPDLSSERGLALMQMNFYAFIQECLLQAMEGLAEENG